jgi:hypothetical protein
MISWGGGLAQGMMLRIVRNILVVILSPIVVLLVFDWGLGHEDIMRWVWHKKAG